MGIIELRQIGENNWKAKYNGNYGVYTINITKDGKETVKYFCSCPSDNYPCKHIGIIEEVIDEEMAIRIKQERSRRLQVKDLIKDVSVQKLREFIITQAKYDREFLNTVLLEFASQVKNAKGNKYSRIIQEALESILPSDYGYEDDYYSEETLIIDVLDQWLDKARDCLCMEQYDEAILICKACVEEYSQWLYTLRENIARQFSLEYQTIPFRIMGETAEHIDKKELLDYCLSEMKKRKYDDTYFYDNFNLLLEELAATVDPDAFIVLQDELLAEIEDRSSLVAEAVLWRKINFWRRIGNSDKAWTLIEENMQIESFRQEAVERMIEEQNFPEAKKLIYDFLADCVTEEGKTNERHIDCTWNEQLLDIAQKEKDVLAIRKLAYGFIEDYFKKEYYEIYKAAFSPGEWAEERERLFLLYADKDNYLNHSAADLLAAENDAERLINYMEKHLSLRELEEYYNVFATAYPEKTLKLFRKALIIYAERNIGRSHYEYIHAVLKNISRIKGGKKAVSDLTADFKIRYKNRKAMMEILGGDKKHS
ncbi:MAG: SWIM zinc finger family protein [Treponema sp.]|nr:SWIM zinc finger family protein [Treponema sp.]